MKNNLLLFLTLAFLVLSSKVYSQSINGNEITIKGNKYFKKNGRYFIRYKKDSFELDTLTISVKFKSTVSENLIQNFENALKLRRIGQKNILNYYTYKCDSFRVAGKSTFIDLFAVLVNLPIIEVAEVNSYGRFLWTPNDPSYSSQWHHDFIQMSNAWNITKGDNSSVVVGIIDSGTQWTHSDIGYGSDSYSNIFYNTGEDTWSNPFNPATGNGIDDDNNGYIDDWVGWNFGSNNNDVSDNYTGLGHGTAVTGIISAKTNNNYGISGIAGGNNVSGIKVLLIKAGTVSLTVVSVTNSILYAIDRGVNIINISLAGSPSVMMDNAIQLAKQNNILMIAASGNDGGDVSYPASNEFVMSVGNIQSDYFINNFSNYGVQLDVVAPGTDIVSATNTNGTSSSFTGTSFASPIVSGVCALVKDVNECLSTENIKDIVCMTADKVNAVNYDYYWYSERGLKSDITGYGLINAYDAVNTANQMKVTGADLYMKDQPWDFGIETNPDGNELFLSEDIWVRNQQDGLLNRQHQTPSFTGTSPVYIYVRVRNKGCQSSSGEEQLKVYWSKANTALNWPNQWVNFYLNSLKHGDIVASAPKTIPVIQPGEESIIEFEWWPPNPSDFVNLYGTDAGHFCLLARIETSSSSPYGMTSAETTSTPHNVKNNNNIVWKNITLVNSPGKKGRVFIGNPTSGSINSRLNFKINGGSHSGKVKIKLDSVLYARWVAGGMSGNNITAVNNIITIQNTQAYIDNITIYGEEYFNIEFDFDSITTHHYNYFVLDVDQSYLSGSTSVYLGSERFLLKDTYVAPEGGSEESQIKNVKPNFDKQQQFLIYPNPSSSILRLQETKNKFTGTLPIKMFNQLGRLVYNSDTQFYSGQASIDMQQFPKGVYLIIINNGYREKIINN